jgi:acetyl esterase
LQTVTYKTTDGNQIQGSFWKTPEDSNKPTIIYIHGGGLIFGNRDDLPQAYIDLFLKFGYSVFSLDYLLAPESSFSAIIDSLRTGVKYFLSHADDLNLQHNHYILFGRSAGAYLSMQLMAGELPESPEAFIDFYGFESLLSSNLLKPNALYSSYPAVSEAEVNQLVGNSPISHSSYEERFLIYVYARQTAKWQKMIFKNDNETEVKISQSILKKQFPPTYMCQSNSDPDVPFINSIMLKAKLPNAKLIPVTSKDHDFDRSVATGTIRIYSNVIEWLNNITK